MVMSTWIVTAILQSHTKFFIMHHDRKMEKESNSMEVDGVESSEVQDYYICPRCNTADSYIAVIL